MEDEYLIYETNLCNKFQKEGSVKFYSLNSNIYNYKNLFSFVLYYNENNIKIEFKDSFYYIGLLIYVNIIQEFQKNKKNYGMIIYTDKKTFPILKKNYLEYKHIIIAVVTWPKFAIEDRIEGSILRCLRFHALEAFPKSNILIRDADTIFIHEISNIIYVYREHLKKNDKNSEIYNSYINFLIEKIKEWEESFIKGWTKRKKSLVKRLMGYKYTIILGVDLTYLDTWHSEFPFNNTNALILKKTLLKLDYGIKPPCGSFAGFINLSNSRDICIWEKSFCYLNSHYYLKNNKIINKGNKSYIGKDERIILYTIIVNYLKDSFFFPIIYIGAIRDYQKCSNINEEKKNKIINNYVKNYERYSYRIKIIKPILLKTILNENKETYFIFTGILDSKYIEKSFELILSKSTIKNMIMSNKTTYGYYLSNMNLNQSKLNKMTQKEINNFYIKYLDYYINGHGIYTIMLNKLSKELIKKNNYYKISFNNIYKNAFKIFSKKYLDWIKDKGKNQINIQELKKKSNELREEYDKKYSQYNKNYNKNIMSQYSELNKIQNLSNDKIIKRVGLNCLE